jgi:Fe-S cluster biogenesis protein NfuA
MTDAQITQLKELLEALRTNLQNDGGDLELKKVEGNTVYLKLLGHCGACPYAMMTLKNGIERILREQISEDIVVERVEE